MVSEMHWLSTKNQTRTQSKLNLFLPSLSAKKGFVSKANAKGLPSTNGYVATTSLSA
jgi:hypothetical protein